MYYTTEVPSSIIQEDFVLTGDMKALAKPVVGRPMVMRRCHKYFCGVVPIVNMIDCEGPSARERGEKQSAVA